MSKHRLLSGFHCPWEVRSSSHRCFSHSPADLGSQRERLLVLSNTHKPAEELHIEGSLQVVPAEGCSGQAAWQLLNRGSFSPPLVTFVIGIQHRIEVSHSAVEKPTNRHGGSSGSVIFQVREERCDPASDHRTAALLVEFVE